MYCPTLRASLVHVRYLIIRLSAGLHSMNDFFLKNANFDMMKTGLNSSMSQLSIGSLFSPKVQVWTKICHFSWGYPDQEWQIYCFQDLGLHIHTNMDRSNQIQAGHSPWLSTGGAFLCFRVIKVQSHDGILDWCTLWVSTPNFSVWGISNCEHEKQIYYRTTRDPDYL